MKPDWRILYAITAAVLLTGLVLDLKSLYIVAKPLLMVILLLYFLTSSQTYPAWRHLVTLALVFSWAGDVFLISGDWFVAGLASFLVAHVFYIAAYQKTGAAGGSLQPLVLPAFALFGVCLLWFIYPGLHELKAPVFLYALVLLGMGVWAFKRKDGTDVASFRLVATGDGRRPVRAVRQSDRREPVRLRHTCRTHPGHDRLHDRPVPDRAGLDPTRGKKMKTAFETFAMITTGRKVP